MRTPNPAIVQTFCWQQLGFSFDLLVTIGLRCHHDGQNKGLE